MTNFTWWVNRKDPDDRNLFQGGFHGDRLKVECPTSSGREMNLEEVAREIARG
ncbi:MAG TPA: hypothetical protein VG371_00610 [Solirubrobacteraceae bacterium]|nr:hypothetical protein [Solirubrobacteraceae bacterium]